MKISLSILTVILIVWLVVSRVMTTGRIASGGEDESAFPVASNAEPYRNSLGMEFVPVPGTDVLFCTTEVTVDQFKACGLEYQQPDFPQTGTHPAVNVSWSEAQHYCDWLSSETGEHYRLPTDHEWSCAVGIGGTEDGSTAPSLKNSKVIADHHAWGSEWPPPSGFENYCGEEFLQPSSAQFAAMERMKEKWNEIQKLDEVETISGYKDNHVFTAPVGSYPKDKLGLHDLSGNVLEWCDTQYYGQSSSKSLRVLRGGSWRHCHELLLRSAIRGKGKPSYRNDACGFRVALLVEGDSGQSTEHEKVKDIK